MPNNEKRKFLHTVQERFGTFQKLPNSQSLFVVRASDVFVYIRYSRLHSRNQAFYGLRKSDLQILEGHPAIVCFLWEDQKEPLLIPYSDYEEIFQTLRPAEDGQYKVQVYRSDEGTELYIPKAGRFNVNAYLGWNVLESIIGRKTESIPDLSHAQVQTIIGAIGTQKGYDIWVPSNDRCKLDWELAKQFECRSELVVINDIHDIVEEVDVVWIRRGTNDMKALFEVEHSTPIYSGLLRFNDIHLMYPDPTRKFSIVANDLRRSLFSRQLNRPTFRTSGLSEVCTFLEYFDVYKWYLQSSSKEV